MVIIIPRIPRPTTRRDLRDFVETVLVKWLRIPFSVHPKVVSCRILSATTRSGAVERHGLITVTPDHAARKVINKLNGASLNGQRVGVKPYDPGIEEAMDGLA